MMQINIEVLTFVFKIIYESIQFWLYNMQMLGAGICQVGQEAP